MFAPLALLTVLAVAGGARTDYCYRGVSVNTETFTVTGQSGWDARSVEAHVRPVAGAAGSMGIVLHYQDSSNFYLFIYSTASSALRIFRRTGGNYIQLASTPLVIPFGEEHTMRAETDGQGNLSLYWDDVLRASAFDTILSAGRVGLRVITMTGTFDDVVARDAQGDVLLADDFDDGNADGWSAGNGWAVIAEGGVSMPQPAFDTSFEGGNIQVTGVDPLTWTVRVTPQLKGTSPYRAWFYFRMSNLSPAQPTNLVFENADFFTQPPYYSYDNLNWSEFPDPSGNVYSLTFTEDSVWIAHSIPYLTTHEQELIDDVQGPHVQTSVLTVSEGGHPVHRLTITEPNGLPDKYGIWFVARQHAWEASGSWVADGLARWLVSSDPQAVALRAKAVLNLVPIMDPDNVILGGSGKDQQPIDLNRDWRSAPYWNAVREVIGAIDSVAAAESYDLFFDSHCQGVETFLYVQPVHMVPPLYWTRFDEFVQILVANAESSSIPYGGGYKELGPEYHPLWNQISIWHQYNAHSELRLSLAFETQTALLTGYRSWAESIGRTFDEFLPPGTADVDLAGDVPASGVALMGLRPNPFRVAAATWDGRNDAGMPVAGGIYFLRLDTPDLDRPDRSVTDKVTLIR
jgi:Cytosolic carboxypeptidase N-terminal domain/Zinc carboxypeptidase